MAWHHLDITKPHLVYIILGGFTSLFMLCSTFIKERMYIGEATVATLCGVVFGPHAANLIDPNTWGSVDIVTIEFSRIVLVVQCFAVGVELPKFYMEKHWKSVVFLLVPVMTVGWLIVSLFIWWMIPPLSWLDSLVVAACVTATDPVLASSVVGKGKFAKRVPKHLRDLLSAESGCNDGMAFPFIYLSLYLIQYHRNAGDVSFHFVVYVILYECIFGAIFGFTVGYIARHGIKFAERRDLIDRESFLVFYFVVALFCAGSGSILGMDDLLVGFAAGVGFSNDGWFGEKTEESHVSNVIDLLINLAYFVYFGTIIPWEQYNNNIEGLQVWRLVVIAVLVIFFRRIPIMLMLKPFIPDIKTWREALFAGHFGPIGVGAIFVAILARAELEHEEPVPLSEMPPVGTEYYSLIYLVWPITTFLVITSILIHGSSIAVFTLGKRINTLTLTMSYTAAPEDGPSWMNRLPRISSQSRSQAKAMSETSMDDYKDPEFPPGTLAPPDHFLRRQRDDDNGSKGNSRASSLVSRKRKNKTWDDGIGPGGPISQSAIFPNRSNSTPLSPADLPEKELTPPARETTDSSLTDDPKDGDLEKGRVEDDEIRPHLHGHEHADSEVPKAQKVEMYEEGDQMVFENEDGDVLDVQPSPNNSNEELPRPNEAPLGRARSKSEGGGGGHFAWTVDGFKKKMTDMYSSEVDKRKAKTADTRRHEPARAFQFGNTIIVEDEDGEVVKTYELPSQKAETGEGSDLLGTSLKYMGLGGRAKAIGKAREAAAEEGQAQAQGEGSRPSAPRTQSKNVWTAGLGRLGASNAVQKAAQAKMAEQQAADDKKVRFTIGGVGQRMTKEDFMREVQKLDVGTRKEVVDQSSASQAVKTLAKQEPSRMSGRPGIPQIMEHGPSSSNASTERVARPRHTRQRSASSPIATRKLGESSSSRSPSARDQPPDETGETAVERKRRLAVLSTQADEEESGETPAERRRREAALGMAAEGLAESDSDDEGSERVPPAKRGIRFAEPTRQGR